MDLPRPEVTVTDPRQPGVLVPAEAPEPPRLGRRGTAVLAACAVVGSVALVSADVVRDRRDAAEQRRLDGVVDLALEDVRAGWSSEHDARTGTGTVTTVVRLVNRGPRTVRVDSARLGPLQALRSTVLEPGEDRPLLLERTVRCPDDGPPPAQGLARRELHLALRTPAGPRRVVLGGAGLPGGSLDDSVQRACLFPPLGDSVRLAAGLLGTGDRTALLRVDVANEGRVPVRLLSLVPSRGLVVESVGGDAPGLPLVLPPVRPGRVPPVRTLEVRVGVVCGALLGADLLRPFEELSAIVEDEGRSQLTSVGALTRDPDGRLRQLAGRTCSSGVRAS